MTEVELVEQIAEYVELDLDNFTKTPSKRRFGEPFSFNEEAPKDLVNQYGSCRKWDGNNYIVKLNHPQAIYLAQLVAKKCEAPLRVRSIDTAMEVHDFEKDTFVGQNYWENNREVFLKFVDSLCVVPYPKVVPEGKRLAYNYRYRRRSRS